MVREGASADGAAAVGEANVGGTGNAAALSPRQELAVREIVRGRSVTAAAHAAGVSRQTVYRWMAEPPSAADEHSEPDEHSKPRTAQTGTVEDPSEAEDP